MRDLRIQPTYNYTLHEDDTRTPGLDSYMANAIWSLDPWQDPTYWWGKCREVVVNAISFVVG